MSARGMLSAALLTAVLASPPDGFGESVSLPATGQQTCTDAVGAVIPCAGSGQDGDTLNGASWPAPRFADNGDGTHTDRLTGLTWLADANCAASVGHDPDGTGDGTVLWDSALEFIAAVNAESYPACAAGHNDWRLPNVLEMESLVQGEGDTRTWLAGAGFGSVEDGYFSSTSDPRAPGNALFVSLHSGMVSSIGKDYAVGAVWPVRGGSLDGTADPAYPANLWATGQAVCWDVWGTAVDCAGTGQDGEFRAGVAWPDPRFTDNADGTVTDGLTGLTWLQDANCIAGQYSGLAADGGVAWQAALDFVAGINDGTYPACGAGYDGWQLPNRKQLLSLMDYSQANPSLPAGHPFLDAPNALVPSGYWSSTTYPTNPAWAWQLYHRGGQLNGAPKTSAYLVWPVRGAAAPPPPAGDLGLSPASLDFGSVVRGGISSPQELTLSNDGTGLLTVSGIALTGTDAAHFALDLAGGASPCGSAAPTLDPAAACTVTLTFQPTSSGAKDALVRIASGDPDQPLVDVPLSGTGTVPTAVGFPDAALEEAIRTALDLPSGDLTPAALETLTVLDLNGLGISDLGGLEYCTNLETLILSANQISDLGPLADLVGLSFLNLYDNQIADVSPLSGLFTLVYLSLGRNQIVDIGPLAGLTNLTDLHLDENRIADTAALGFLTRLQNLGVSSNRIADLADLAGNNGLAAGDRIWIEDNPLDLSAASAAAVDIRTLQDRGATVYHDPVGSLFADANLETVVAEALDMVGAILLPADLAMLTSLDASSRDIADLEGLQYCTGLTELYLHDNRIPEITQLSALTGLTTLNLAINQVDRVVALGGLTGLTWLNLSSNQIREITSLANLTGLTQLFLSGNRVANISPVAGLENLAALALSDNDITDIEALVSNFGLGNGDTLWLTGNPLELWYGSQTVAYIWALEASGITVHHDPFTFYDAALGDAVAAQLGIPLAEITLEQLQTLQMLDARDLAIADLRGVSLMLALESLYLQGNRIADLSPLSTLPNLRILNLEGNQVADLLPLSGLTTLSQLNLSGNPVTDLSPLAANPGIGAGDRVWLFDTTLDLSPGSAAAAHIWTLLQRGAIVFQPPVSALFLDAQLEAAVALALGIPPSDLRPSNLDTLDALDASNRFITDLTGIHYCHNLTNLNLSGNEIVDISHVTGNDNLRALILHGNRIVDINGLHTMAGLDWLDLRNNQITNINILRGNTWMEEDDRLLVEGNLLEMWVGSSAVRTLYILYPRGAVLGYDPLYFRDANLEAGVLEVLGLSPRDIMLPTLVDLSEMAEIDLQHRSIADITGLEYATAVEILTLHRNAIRDVAPLQELQNLTALSLGSNQVADIEPLRNLVHIQDLYLFDNQVASLWPLSGLNELRRLEAGTNPFADITPIAPIRSLSYLSVSGTNVDTVADLLDNPQFGDGDELWAEGTAMDLTIGSPDVQDLCALWARGVEVHMGPIRFSDPAITVGVLAELGNPAGSIDCWDLEPIAEITTLDLSDRGVVDLAGMEHLEALQQLDLSSNRIEDLAPLATLVALQSLDLSGNRLTDLAPLVANPGLASGDELWLNDNPLLPLWEGTAVHEQIAALSNRGVTVHHDGVSGDPFPDPVLEQAVRDALEMGPLEGFTTAGLESLTALDLTRSAVADLEGLQYCPNLATLNLRETQVADLSPLRGLGSLRVLNLSLTQVTDPSPLAVTPGLIELHLYGAPIANWSGVSSLTGLQTLSFGDNGSNELNWIASLTGLTTLWVEEMTPVDLAPLAGLTALQTLHWEDSGLQDISPLGSLTHLETLELGGNEITDISTLASLSSVRTLSLRNNLVQDISVLEELTGLEFLVLDSNRIDNLLPLVRNEGLGEGDRVSLYNNDSLDLQLLADGGSILLLVERGVQVYSDPVADYDGVDAGEEMGPTGSDREYDGNGDGTPDHLQANVASFHNHDGEHYVTLEVNLPYWLEGVAAEPNPSPGDMPPGVECPLGFFSFRIQDVPAGGAAEVRLFLAEGTEMSTYWKYGITSQKSFSHWYEFLYDGQTGAEIEGNVITLHFVNDQRGDTALGFDAIWDPGAPAVNVPAPPAEGGGGGGGGGGFCFLSALGLAAP